MSYCEVWRAVNRLLKSSYPQTQSEQPSLIMEEVLK